MNCFELCQRSNYRMLRQSGGNQETTKHSPAIRSRGTRATDSQSSEQEQRYVTAGHLLHGRQNRHVYKHTWVSAVVASNNRVQNGAYIEKSNKILFFM